MRGGVVPFRFAGQSDGPSSMSFSVSLADVLKYSTDQDARRLNAGATPMGLGGKVGPGVYTPSRFDIWAEGRIVKFGDDRMKQDADGDFGVLYLGADYVVNPWLLVGTLVQYNSMTMRSTAQSYEVSGHGWLTGPYATVKLTENLFWQSRVAWGRSNNSISPYLTYEDTFGSERWLGRSTLQGYWEHGPWRFMPSATVGYIEDKTEAYTDSLGVAIPSAKSTLGQLKFGPEASYRFMNASGDTIEPRAKLEAIWNFTHSSIGYTELDAVSGTDEWRGRVEVGLRLQTRIGQILDFSTAYDGIGSGSYSAVSGTATLRFPLN